MARMLGAPLGAILKQVREGRQVALHDATSSGRAGRAAQRLLHRVEVVLPIAGAPEVRSAARSGLRVVLQEHVARADRDVGAGAVALEDLGPLDLEDGVAERAVVAAVEQREVGDGVRVGGTAVTSGREEVDERLVQGAGSQPAELVGLSSTSSTRARTGAFRPASTSSKTASASRCSESHASHCSARLSRSAFWAWMCSSDQRRSRAPEGVPLGRVLPSTQRLDVHQQQGPAGLGARVGQVREVRLGQIEAVADQHVKLQPRTGTWPVRARV